MDTLGFPKIKQLKAQEITDLFDLDEIGQTLLSADIASVDYIKVLIEKEAYTDAIKFFAYALPKREAVWWACQCARTCLGENEGAFDQKSIECAEAWVYKPTQENALLNSKIAEAAEFKTAASWASMSAFWSGDNISPIEGNVVPPANDLTAKAVVGSVMMAAVENGAEKSAEKNKLFLQIAIDIANGGDGRNV